MQSVNPDSEHEALTEEKEEPTKYAKTKGIMGTFLVPSVDLAGKRLHCKLSSVRITEKDFPHCCEAPRAHARCFCVCFLGIGVSELPGKEVQKRRDVSYLPGRVRRPPGLGWHQKIRGVG
jgi:hypothetical protein